jgi:hypothetical protein
MLTTIVKLERHVRSTPQEKKDPEREFSILHYSFSSARLQEESTFTEEVHRQVRKFAHIGRQWLTPVILATQKAEIRRITVQSQPKQIVSRDPILKTLHKNRAGEGPA